MIRTVDINDYCKSDYIELLSEHRQKMFKGTINYSVTKDYSFILKIKKNKKYVIPIPRNHDIFSNFSFSYKCPINYIDFKNLPYEINDKIKSFILPSINPEINLCIDDNIDKFNINNIAQKSDIANFKHDIVNKSIKLPVDANNIDYSLLNDISNGIPMCIIDYKSVFLTILSDREVNLRINFRGSMIDASRRLLLNKLGRIYYNNETKLIVGLGIIVKSKINNIYR